MSRKHSRFAPSSLYRVLACPRSVALAEAAVRDDPTRAQASSYAAQGTVAHDIAADYLRGIALPPAYTPGMIIGEDGHFIEIDGAMHGHALEYASYVRSLMPRDGVLLVEEVVDLDEVVGSAAEMYGHLDAATWSLKAGHLSVVDYKYGAGIKVSPVENPQLMTYALGALFRLPKAERHQIHTVSLHVFQPRTADGVSSWEIAAVDLLMWGAETLAPTIKAIIADADLPPLTTGDHCRFCRALTTCPAWAAKVESEMREAFSAPISGLVDADLAAALTRVRELAPFIEGIEEEAKRRLVEQRVDVPGFKPVVSQWRRFWSNGVDPAAIAKALDLKAKDVMTDPVLRSPADVEKKLKKSDRGKLEPLVERKPYGVSIVASSDPRPDSREGNSA